MSRSFCLMLHVGVWMWGSKYTLAHLDRLRDGISRHLGLPFAFHVFSPLPEDEHLKAGCLCRVRAFDHVWQQSQGIYVGDRLVVMDLDSIVVAGLDEIFSRREPFVILQGANSSNPCPYNGSLMMLQACYRPDIWHSMTPEVLAECPRYAFVDDQSFLAWQLPDAAGWKAGAESGVYAFQKPGWPKGTDLPADARLVVFPGWRDPSKFTHLPWVRKHWVS